MSENFEKATIYRDKLNEANAKKTKTDHFFFMKIHPDGSFLIGEKTKDLFNQEEYEISKDGAFVLKKTNVHPLKYDRYYDCDHEDDPMMKYIR